MSFTGRDEVFSNTELSNNGFLPGVKVGDFQEQYKVANTYSLDVVLNVLILAMIEINGRVKAQQAQWQLEGASTLDQAPGQDLPTQFVTLYFAAVMHWAKSELIRRYTTVTSRKVSDVTSDKAEQTEDWYRQRADQYTRQLLGKAGVTCELL